MADVDDELRAELLRRADRDQAARESLPAEHGMREWEETVAPVDRANTARLQEIAGEHGWPGHQLVGEEAALGLEPEAQNRARLLARRPDQATPG